MKKLALTSILISVPVVTLCGQSQSDIDFLRARADAHERKISQLEQELSRLKAFHADKAVAAADTSQTQAPRAIPVEGGDANVSTYVVKQGDILTSIAQRHQTTVAAIIRENGLSSDMIYVGQKLQVPTTTSPLKPAATASTEPAKAVQAAKHQVSSGETFYSIARLHGVSVSSLSASNPDVEPTRLHVGQMLVIDGGAKSAVAVSSENSTAKTTSSVAQAPAKAAPAASKAPAPRDPAPAPGKPDTDIRTITVNEQMTYGQLASRYGASTTQLNALNGLSLNKNTMLARGSELYVPKY